MFAPATKVMTVEAASKSDAVKTAVSFMSQHVGGEILTEQRVDVAEQHHRVNSIIESFGVVQKPRRASCPRSALCRRLLMGSATVLRKKSGARVPVFRRGPNW